MPVEKTILLHWVWVGDTLPPLDKVAHTIQQLENKRIEDKTYTGAVWFLCTDTINPNTKHIKAKYKDSDVQSLDNLSNTTYKSFNTDAAIIPLTEFELKSEIGSNKIIVPIFAIYLTNSETKWWKNQFAMTCEPVGAMPCIVQSIAAKIALSDLIRLFVLGTHAGLYLDYDAFVKDGVDFGNLLRLDSVACHTKNNGVYENDFIWVPKATQEEQNNIMGLYKEILREKEILSFDDKKFNFRIWEDEYPKYTEELKNFGSEPVMWSHIDYFLKGPGKRDIDECVGRIDSSLLEVQQKNPCIRAFVTLDGEKVKEVTWSRFGPK